MAIVCGCNLDDTNVSAKGLQYAAPVQVKIQQVQDLIKQMNEKMFYTFGNLRRKQTAHDRNQEWLSKLKWEEMWYQRYTVSGLGFETIPYKSDEGTYKHDVQPTIGEQDELIRDLRYKLLQKSKCLAEEKKLIRQIREAEEIRESLVADPKPEIHRTYYAKETNASQVCRAKMQKKKYEKKVPEDLDSDRKKKLRSLQEILIRMNEKRIRVHGMIYDLEKHYGQQEELPDAHIAASNVSTTNIQVE